jgi:hypothetical protein
MTARQSGEARPEKLVLAVIDGCRPEVLDRVIAAGGAPTLAALIERGVYVDRLVSNFPSVTPACVATIATGVRQDRHRIPAMCWYSREEERYVDYGSSFQATRAFGIARSMTDTIYNMNLSHMAKDVETVFETLDDAGVRTAGTTFLMYRGRHRHEPTGETALAKLVTTALFKHAVYGPRELFYADLFSSRETGCRSQLGLPGVRDAHAGCVGSYLVERDLFDFLLLSLPDNDSHSHRFGIAAQEESIGIADRELARVMDAAGGIEDFLARYAVIVVSDHSHAQVEHRVALLEGLSQWRVLRPNDLRPETAEIAVCPGQRSAMVYMLDEEGAARERDAEEVAEVALGIDGIDLAMHMRGGWAVVRAGGGAELRFRAGGEISDRRGARWSVRGDLDVLGAEIDGETFSSPDYPDALGRIWAALACPSSGDVLLSTAPAWECVDWGGIDHVGAGSHGSLHAEDSHGIMICCGTGPDSAAARDEWTLADVAPLVRAHFGLEATLP